MSAQSDIENRASICRVTCGWMKPGLSLETICRYWRDVHSPAISRRAGIYEYRHFQFAPVHTGLFASVAGVRFDAPANEQLMWVSDVRYADQAGLDAFGASPAPNIRAQILGDIEMIVDKSTTYLVLGEKGKTFIDSGKPVPIGPMEQPIYSLFFRRVGDQQEFRDYLATLATAWAKTAGVIRLRLSLFETPDMEAERRAGYPVKTHPIDMQYQAWIDITLESDAVAASLVRPDEPDMAKHVGVLHAYPTKVVYTFVYDGRPTLIGLRGYAAYEAITAMNATHQTKPELLSWMFGEVVKQGPVQ